MVLKETELEIEFKLVVNILILRIWINLVFLIEQMITLPKLSH